MELDILVFILLWVFYIAGILIYFAKRKSQNQIVRVIPIIICCAGWGFLPWTLLYFNEVIFALSPDSTLNKPGFVLLKNVAVIAFRFFYSSLFVLAILGAYIAILYFRDPEAFKNRYMKEFILSAVK